MQVRSALSSGEKTQCWKAAQLYETSAADREACPTFACHLEGKWSAMLLELTIGNPCRTLHRLCSTVVVDQDRYPSMAAKALLSVHSSAVISNLQEAGLDSAVREAAANDLITCDLRMYKLKARRCIRGHVV